MTISCVRCAAPLSVDWRTPKAALVGPLTHCEACAAELAIDTWNAYDTDDDYRAEDWLVDFGTPERAAKEFMQALKDVEPERELRLRKANEWRVVYYAILLHLTRTERRVESYGRPKLVR